MSDDRDHREDRGQEPAGGSAPEQDDGDEERPRITLDRYMSQRRQSAWSWVHLVVLAFMLATLGLLIAYKERCSRAVSNVIYMQNSDRGPAVKNQLSPPPQPRKP